MQNIQSKRDTTSEYGDTTSEYGDTTSEYGGTTSEYGDTTSEYGDTTSEYWDTTSEYGDTTIEYGDRTSEYGKNKIIPSSKKFVCNMLIDFTTNDLDLIKSSYFGDKNFGNVWDRFWLRVIVLPWVYGLCDHMYSNTSRGTWLNIGT